jgi:ribosomal protein S18 acetylase RimI-like enzyme
MSEIAWIEGGTELLDAVGPLWGALNRLHSELSAHFSHADAAGTFDQRKAGLLDKARSATLRVELAQDRRAGRFVGYCVCSVDRDGVGEVDSIYVEPDHRGRGLGHHLMQRALVWMDRQGVRAKVAIVAVGNERVCAFYSRYGFFPRHIVLQQVTGETAFPETGQMGEG